VTDSDLLESVKNAGLVLTALSSVVYACGYLAVRGRARALGADPGSDVLDNAYVKAYVFAGFRFAIALLLSVSVPPLLVLRWLGSFALLLPAGPLFALKTAGVVTTAILTIWGLGRDDQRQ
jgi:hypothetical protein